MANNEITLGDNQPLSNDLKPIKVGGEASILNVSSPTPDGSVDGEFQVKGKLKAKDTIIQGNIKAFTDDDTTAQFIFESTQGANNRFDVRAAANTRSAIRIFNNQGFFELRRDSNTTSLKFTDGTNTPLTLDGNNVEFTNLTDGSITIDSFVDEDNMSSNSATKIPTQQSVKAYVDNEVAGLVDSAPAALDTLNELAAALNDDASFSTTITNSLATKVGLTGDETIAGTKTFTSTVKLLAGSPKLIFKDSTDDDDHVIEFRDESDNLVHTIRTNDNTGGGLGDSLCLGSVENKPLQFITQDTTRMVIDGSGNVGIGTTSPDSNLHIKSSSGSEPVLQLETALDGGGADTFIRLGDSTENYSYALGIDDSSNTFRLAYNGSSYNGAVLGTNDLLTVTTAGNVGIGTTSPTTTLDVEGTVSYKHTSLTANSDDLDVSGVTVVEATPSGTTRLGGLTGGVQGQILYILKVDSGLGRLIIEHNEGTGNQDIFLSGGSDVQLSTRGGMTLYCNGTSWFALDK